MFSFGVTDLQAAKKAPPPPSIAMDEDAQKRNTDCIYFLASPLTCKKGNTCEYRHSEAARTNPRDCWYWKSGNCLNAHCSFRHLPLEGKPASASTASTSTAPTMVQSALGASSTARAGPNKSKTPCYFFSQGYCAKNDKCPFMHGSPVATSPAEGAAQQNSASVVNGKALHASGRPLIVLKQSDLIPQEFRHVTNGRPEAVNEAHPISSRAPGVMQGVPQGLERATHSERVAHFVPFKRDKESNKLMMQADRLYDIPDLANRSRHNNISKTTLQNQDNCGGLAQAGDFRNQTVCQSEALWKDGPAGGSHQSVGSEDSSPSDSRESPKGLINSPACNGQDSDATYGECEGQRVESEGDLRNHLSKRMKTNSSLNSSIGKGGHPDLATQRRRGRTLSGDHSKKQKVEISRSSVVETDFNRVKRPQSNKRESTHLPNEASKQSFKKAQSRSFAFKQPIVDQPKVRNFEAAPMPEKRVHSSSSLTSKSSISESAKETLTFTGPKSLAQIKAEKMAGEESASKAIGRLDSSSTMSEPGSKLADRKSAVLAGSWEAAASNDKVLSTRMGVISIIKKDDAFKHEMANSEKFEGPKPLSALTKRKRELESGSNVKESMPGPTEVQVSMLKCFSETEDGEFCDDDNNSNVDDVHDTCTLVSSQEDSVVMSPSNAKEEVSQGLHRLSGEPAEFETESSDDGSKFDLEMEENAYGGGDDYEIDDDDEDEDDFAKKLGRFFGLSNE